MRHKVQSKTIAPVPLHSTDGLRAVSNRPADIEIQINRRAYELYSARGGRAGRDLEDWFRAEKEIMDI